MAPAVPQLQVSERLREGGEPGALLRRHPHHQERPRQPLLRRQHPIPRHRDRERRRRLLPRHPPRAGKRFGPGGGDSDPEPVPKRGRAGGCSIPGIPGMRRSLRCPSLEFSCAGQGGFTAA